MSNYVIRDTASLFDPATGQWVGVIDSNGAEHVVVPTGGKVLSASTSAQGVTNWDVGGAAITGHVTYSALPKLNNYLRADGKVYSISAYPGLARRLGRVCNGLSAFATRSTSAADNEWRSVCWSSELRLFVAVADTGSGNRVMTSPDGITWTARTSAADNVWYSVCWSPELSLFVAVASSGTGDRVMTSPDGITWTARTSAADNNWVGVCWSPELSLFVAVASSGTGNRVMTSPNGITWTARTSAVDNVWRSVCWSPELSLFVAVALSGSGNRVMTAYGCTYNPLTDFAVPKITAPAGCHAHVFAG